MTLGKQVARYLAALHARGDAATTIKSRRSHLNRFSTWLAGQGVDDVSFSREHIEAYLEELSWTPTWRGRPMGVLARNSNIGSLRGFCRFLYESDLVATNAAESIEYAKRPELLPKAVPSREEMQALLALPTPSSIIGFRDRVVLELLYGTAVRVAELCALDIDDIDLDAHVVLVRHGKGSKGRVVPIGTLLGELLQSYLAAVRPELLARRGDGFAERGLILSQYGERLVARGVEKLVARRARAAGLHHLTPHGFRHACATHMLKNGANVRHLQELLGHRKLDTTMLYTRVTIADLQEAHARFHPRGALTEPEARPGRRRR